MSIRVKGFLKDIKGINKIMDARTSNRVHASSIPDSKDFIHDTVEFLHPSAMQVTVVSIRDASPTARTYRFEAVGREVPVFQCGQYVNFRLKIGSSLLSRPYTISSAPYEARGKQSFFEVTIRRNADYLVPDFFFRQVKVGDVLEANLPFGTFYWEPLRDTKEIVALAGGSGITPFFSMAKEIANGKMKDCKLTILYGSVKADDIVLKDELDAVEKACKNVKVVHVLSDEPSWTGEKGFITRQIIEKYSSPDSTFMFCGPLPMFQFVQKALNEMGVPARRFRHDVINHPADVSTLPGYPKGTEKKTFKITVLRGVQKDVIEAAANEPVAIALERSAIAINTHCRNGECGFCRSQLISGNIFVSPIGDGRRMMDKEMGWFHACSSWPLSDLTIRIPII